MKNHLTADHCIRTLSRKPGIQVTGNGVSIEKGTDIGLKLWRAIDTLNKLGSPYYYVESKRPKTALEKETVKKKQLPKKRVTVD
jgi:hypothetical protein